MTELTKKRKNGNGDSYTSSGNDCFPNRLSVPRIFNFENDFFNTGIAFPPVNIHETNQEFKLDLSVPGMKREDFRIDIENGVLTVSSEKEEEEKESDKNYRRREFSYSSFSRTFTLPDNVKESDINAKYDNGVLHVTIPKKEVSAAKPKKQISVA